MVVKPLLSIVVPSFREPRIHETVAQIHHHCAVRGIKVQIIPIEEPVRKGKGWAVRTGMLQASGDIVGFVDADNKVPIRELDKVLCEFEHGADIVIGERQVLVFRPVHRQIGSAIFRTLMNLELGGIRDPQCGFKFFKRDVAMELFARQRTNGYMFDVEILKKAFERGYRVFQVPVEWRGDADSRLRLVRDNLTNALDLLKIFARRSQ